MKNAMDRVFGHVGEEALEGFTVAMHWLWLGRVRFVRASRKGDKGEEAKHPDFPYKHHFEVLCFRA